MVDSILLYIDYIIIVCLQTDRDGEKRQLPTATSNGGGSQYPAFGVVRRNMISKGCLSVDDVYNNETRTTRQCRSYRDGVSGFCDECTWRVPWRFGALEGDMKWNGVREREGEKYKEVQRKRGTETHISSLY